MYKKYLKRFFDLVFSIILTPFVIVFVLLISPFILFFDRGSIFFCSERLGKDMKPFKMYKIRTMKIGAPDIRNSDGSTFNSDDDDRVTPIGKILRKTSLDELPQIINIFLGQMSFIGPRPDLESQKEEYQTKKRDSTKFMVKPGITGLAQVYGRNNIDWDEKNRLDKRYVENLSFILDLKIFFLTISKVLFQKDVNKTRRG